MELAALAYKDAVAEYDAETDFQLKIKIIETFTVSVGITAFEAVQESWELFTWFMCGLLGPVHYQDTSFIIDAFTDWGNSGNLFGMLSGNTLKSILSRASNVTAALKGAFKTRKSAPVAPADVYDLSSCSQGESDVPTVQTASGGTMKKSLSTGFLSALGSNGDEANGGGKEPKYAEMETERSYQRDLSSEASRQS